MTFAHIDVVEVRAWGRTVGATVLDPASGFYAFEYTDDWVHDGPELAPLHMPNAPGTYVFPNLRPETFYRLPALLADALPDRFGNALIDAWMAGQGISADQTTPLDRLAYTADRAMGALEFRPPADTVDHDDSVIALADLVNAARTALRGELSDGPEATDAVRQLIVVGTSAGGARPKAVIAYNPDTHQMRSGQVDAPDGFEHWLLKLDGVEGDPTRELGEGAGFGMIEFAYHLMARAAGITMTECRLLPEGPRTHFLTRRFDREGPTRHHVATLCALAHLDFNLAGAHSYEQYFLAIEALGLGPAAREQAFRRVVFNVAGMNRDDHTKNLAFVLPGDGDWDLAPAYDITYAHNPTGAWTKVHQMSIAGKREGITIADLETLGDRFAVPGYRNVLAEVTETTERWPDYAAQAGLDQPRTDMIHASLADHRPQ